MSTRCNYDRVPEAVKALRLIPASARSSFTAEVIRTTVGRLQSLRELQSNNLNVRRIGQSRLVGMAIIMVPSILSGVMKAISGVDDEKEGNPVAAPILEPRLHTAVLPQREWRVVICKLPVRRSSGLLPAANHRTVWTRRCQRASVLVSHL